MFFSASKALKALFTSRSTGMARKGRWLTAEELEAYLYALSQPGALTAALNYFRNVFRSFTSYRSYLVRVDAVAVNIQQQS